jgi:Cft2 family RNA processing exonuclease
MQPHTHRTNKPPRWCTSELNGVVMTGYTQEGTLARRLLTHPEVVEDMRGQQQVRLASLVLSVGLSRCLRACVFTICM